MILIGIQSKSTIHVVNKTQTHLILHNKIPTIPRPVKFQCSVGLRNFNEWSEKDQQEIHWKSTSRMLVVSKLCNLLQIEFEDSYENSSHWRDMAIPMRILCQIWWSEIAFCREGTKYISFSKHSIKTWFCLAKNRLLLSTTFITINYLFKNTD